MGKLLLWRSKITRWLTSRDYKNWKTTFFVLSVILSFIISHIFEYDATIFWFAFFTSVGISFSLVYICGIATVRIESLRVVVAWGFINYSLIVATASLFCSQEEWGKSHLIGLFVAIICSSLLICFCSYISYLLKLNDEKEDTGLFSDRESKFNGCRFYLLVTFTILICFLHIESNQLNNYRNEQKSKQKELLYKQEKWYPVTEYNVETLDGNTVYIVKCARGRVAIYPSKYPKIRDITSETKIKYLVGQKKNGLIFPERLDIEN